MSHDLRAFHGRRRSQSRITNAYLEGTCSEVHLDKSEDAEGSKFFSQFSFPGDIGSHCIPETTGSIPKGRRNQPERP